jgi:hypothetical protein
MSPRAGEGVKNYDSPSRLRLEATVCTPSTGAPRELVEFEAIAGRVVFFAATVVVGAVVVDCWPRNIPAIDGSTAKTATPVNAFWTSTTRGPMIFAITSLSPMLAKKLSAAFCRTFHCGNAGSSVLFVTTSVNDLLPLGRLLLDVTISEAREICC